MMCKIKKYQIKVEFYRGKWTSVPTMCECLDVDLSDKISRKAPVFYLQQSRYTRYFCVGLSLKTVTDIFSFSKRVCDRFLPVCRSIIKGQNLGIV